MSVMAQKGRYEAYIQSAAWRDSPARQQELRLSKGRCRLCARQPPEACIEVHHNTYARLGHERPEDLCTLCRECHADITDVLRRRRYAAAALPLPADTPRALAGRTLADLDWSLPDA